MSHYEQYVGKIFDGRYRIDALLGVGGMAAVMVAYDLEEKRNVAVKMLREEMSDDKQAIKRFINESKAIAAMDHPNIVKIYDVVVSSDIKYIVMEYIEGETLRDYMDKTGPIPFENSVSILSQILDALEHAHEKGIIHRDIKPQNIMITKSGKIVVTDFGIAKIAGGETMMDGKAIGTVYYISPEQAEGGNIDERSDIYSLGAMLFEMLTGRLPFNGESTLAIAMMQINEAPPMPRDFLPTIPKGMEEIVLYALKKEPEERFQSARQMADYLDVLKTDPFAEFAISPKEQYKIAMEDARKARERDEEEKEKKDRQEKSSEGEEVFVKHVRGDSWSPVPVMLGIGLAFVMALVIGGYYAVVNIFWNSELNVFKDRSGENVVIENYLGKGFTEDDRAYLLEELGYQKVTIKEEYSEEVEKGRVISQEPSAGEVRKLSTVELTVTVSKGSHTVENYFPDYSMMDYREVRLILLEQGYTVVLVPVESSAVDSCMILRTEPAAGDHLPADNKVTVYYSLGVNAEKVMHTFPNFVGMSEVSVKSYVKSYGLNLSSVSYAYSDTVEAGKVISSNVASGPRPKLTPLVLVISLGVDPNKPVDPFPMPFPDDSQLRDFL